MATTTGTINTVTVTLTQIITDALQDLRQLSDGASPSTGDVTDCTRKLNFLLKKWSTKGLLLWCLDTLVLPCVANKTSYTIGPSGADLTSYRPMRVLEGTFVRLLTAGLPYDTPLTILSRLEYAQEGAKGALGIVNSVYYDPQMTQTPNVSYNPANSAGVLYVFVTPLDATRTIYLKVQRPIQDIVAAGDTFDLPLEWYEALTKNLSAAVADKYEVPEDRIRRIKQEAVAALAEITDWAATEEATMYFQPDYQGG